jgi:hypothetical protein
VGLGASVSVAVAGIVVAGLGLLTMHSAFQPLPKPGTPVVLIRADRPLASTLLHPSSLASAPVVHPDVLTEDAPVNAAPIASVKAARLQERADASLQAEIKTQPAAVTQTPLPAAAAPKAVAEAAPADQGKLCKAPAPDDISSKVLQPGLILRYDTKFKSTPIDIPPPGPQPEEQRRLKLSALLADMLDN